MMINTPIQIIKKEILTLPLSQINVNQVDYNKVLEEYNALPYQVDTSLGKSTFGQKTLRVHPFIRPYNINLPILVNRYGKSKYKLINGYHRFIQAQQNNSTNIKVQVLNRYLHHFV